jgi:hypothetical protein
MSTQKDRIKKLKGDMQELKDNVQKLMTISQQQLVTSMTPPSKG